MKELLSWFIVISLFLSILACEPGCDPLIRNQREEGVFIYIYMMCIKMGH